MNTPPSGGVFIFLAGGVGKVDQAFHLLGQDLRI
jgi:hypothetical protein